MEAKLSRSLSVLFVLLSTCVSLSAQWLHYPTAGVPRLPDGKPNLSAPAPKTPDGKPDFSGIWNIQDKPGDTQFLDLAPSVEGGLPYRSGMAELAKARSAPPKTTEPITRCLPIGIVERHTWIGGLKKVVQTTGFRDGQWLDTEGNPLTDAARITERFHRVDFGHLTVDITVDDPKAYTKPWTFKVNQVLVPDTELLEFICLENEKDVQHMNAGAQK